MNGSVVSYFGGLTPDEGIDVYISPELQGNISTAMASDCENITDQCVQGVKDILSNPSTELQARNPVLLAAGALGFLNILYPAFHLYNSPEPVPIHISIPPELLTAVAGETTATVTIVTVSDTAFTITPSPEPTGITG